MMTTEHYVTATARALARVIWPRWVTLASFDEQRALFPWIGGDAPSTRRTDQVVERVLARTDVSSPGFPAAIAMSNAVGATRTFGHTTGPLYLRHATTWVAWEQWPHPMPVPEDISAPWF